MKKTLTKKAGIISIITVVWVMTMPAVASTNVPAGPIIMDTTWTESGSPYILNGSIVVGFDATLTIDPNVQVKLKSGFGLTIGSDAFGKGTLVAEGTQAEPITFTSIKDPCDVNDPARPGDWVQIHFTDFAEDAEPDGMGGFTGCVMDHVILEYAGQFAQAAILAERSSPLLRSCTIRHNAGIGIAADGSTTPPINISNCEIWDHPGRGISISKGVGHNISNCDIYDNGGGVYITNAASNILTSNTIYDNSINAQGGGIYFNSAGSNILTDNTITGNTSTNNSGGGISFNNSGSNTLTNNTISGNSAWTYGGGIYSNLGNNTLEINTINNNVAVHYYGGGIYMAGGGNELTDNTISFNTADGGSGHGGGIYLGGHTNTLTGNQINDNRSNINGGGLYLANNNHVLTGNTISDNITNQNGGGVFNYRGTAHEFNGNTISGNTAFNHGGGLYADRGHSNTFTSNVIRANTATYEGGGLFLTDCDNNVFSFSTIAFNKTAVGETGGIYVTNGSANLSLAGDPDEDIFNTIVGNEEYWIYNNNDKSMGAAADIDAGFVQWGTNDGMILNDRLYDFFDNATKGFIKYPPIMLPADFDQDGDVDMIDLETFLWYHWLRTDCAQPDWCSGADMDVDGDVDFVDYVLFCELFTY